jgi:hypothetical protein
VVTAVTDPEYGDGRYRNPVPLSDGRLLASHTPPYEDTADYSFRLREIVDGEAGGVVTGEGIRRTLRWWDPDAERSFDGVLWELDAVEVVAREAPAPRQSTVEAPEAAVLADLGVDEQALRAWMRERELALVVVRNATLRDRGDLNQPYNLRVPGGAEAIAADGKVYDITHLQLFEAQALRGYEGRAGRRLLGRPSPIPYPDADGPEGSVEIATDGSIAAFVPATRAMSWQLLDPDGAAVVRERNWVSFAPGEIRGCPVCHGANTETQLGTGVPTNEPEALRALLTRWLADQ